MIRKGVLASNLQNTTVFGLKKHLQKNSLVVSCISSKAQLFWMFCALAPSQGASNQLLGASTNALSHALSAMFDISSRKSWNSDWMFYIVVSSRLKTTFTSFVILGTVPQNTETANLVSQTSRIPRFRTICWRVTTLVHEDHGKSCGTSVMRPTRPLAANNKTLRFAERLLLAHLPGPAAWVGHHHFARSKCVPANFGEGTPQPAWLKSNIYLGYMYWRAKISSI